MATGGGGGGGGSGYSGTRSSGLTAGSQSNLNNFIIP